jgi:hypothetical protein
VTLSSIDFGKEAPRLNYSHLGKYRITYPLTGIGLVIVNDAVNIEYAPTIGELIMRLPEDVATSYGKYYTDTVDEESNTALFDCFND